MNFLPTLNSIMRKSLYNKLEATLAIIEAFDFSVFENLDEEQLSIHDINITISKENRFIFSKTYRIEIVSDASDHYYRYENPHNLYINGRYEPMFVDVTFKALINDCKLKRIEMRIQGQSYNNDRLLNILVGKEKILINSEWFDIMGLEEKIFQMSTVKSPEPFDLPSIGEMFRKLHLFNDRGEK
ncbi:hypothetical protein ENKO_373 [Klebsiella phage fENko-Kae01]|nr:hypothetical protein [Klebsiella phage fENko-Kae01]